MSATEEEKTTRDEGEGEGPPSRGASLLEELAAAQGAEDALPRQWMLGELLEDRPRRPPARRR
jgi:hypothetical protein